MAGHLPVCSVCCTVSTTVSSMLLACKQLCIGCSWQTTIVSEYATSLAAKVLTPLTIHFPSWHWGIRLVLGGVIRLWLLLRRLRLRLTAAVVATIVAAAIVAAAAAIRCALVVPVVAAHASEATGAAGVWPSLAAGR